MNNIDSNFLSSSGLIIDLVYFVFVILITLIIWSVFIVISTISPVVSLKNANQKDLYWLVIVTANITFVVAVSSYLYPTSLTSYLRSHFLSQPEVFATMGISLLFLFYRGWLSICTKISVITTSSLLLLFLAIPLLIPSDKYQDLVSTPNIIIVGVDGLRPDHLVTFGGDKNLTPFLNNQLENSIVYKNAYTPQGRTYVAWMSLLTGKYPVNNGVRFNLAPPEVVDKRLPVIEHLKSEGYHTSYAIDERRFNQIDYSYGFDAVIGPKIGVADAIISGFGDLPFLNVLLQHPYAASLLPYLYNNRAYGKAYSPNSFNDDVINNLSVDKPNFLALHYCQLHWPYTSKDFIPEPKEHWDGNYNHYMYKEMLKSVDNQLSDIFTKLEEKGLLKNAIVYIISDHGESFNQDQYSPIQMSKSSIPKPKSWGHGTNILDQQQSHILMAKVKFKDDKVVTTPSVLEGTYSLVDIVPSILSEMGLPSAELTHLDGLPLPDEETMTQNNRFIFVESSLPVKSINKSFIDKNEVMSETASHYELRNDGRAYMKLENYSDLIAKKQRAVYFQNWQLSMLPNVNELVLLDITNNKIYTDNTYEGDFNWTPMLTALCLQYQGDPGFDPHSICDQPTSLYSGR
ncbi:sulfatase-like hydrolase/transferase [Shewanella sp. 125m-7]